MQQSPLIVNHSCLTCRQPATQDIAMKTVMLPGIAGKITAADPPPLPQAFW